MSYISIATAVRHLRNSAFARDATILSIGTAIAQGIGVVATPILARIFTPEDFGVYALYTAISAVVATLVTLRYEVRILLPGSELEASRLLSLVLVLILSTGSAIVVLSLAYSQIFGGIVSPESDLHWLTLACLAGVFGAIISGVNYWLNRIGDYSRIAGLRILQALVSAALAVAAGLLFIQNGLILAHILSMLVMLVLYATFGRAPILRFFSWKQLSTVGRAHRRAPLYLLPTALIDSFVTQLPVILIISLFSSELAGNYRMAWLLLGLPGVLIGGAFAQVFFQRMSIRWANRQPVKRMLIKSWLILASLGVAPMITIMIFGETIFNVFLGEQWREAGKMGVILAPFYFFSLIHSPTSSALIVLGLERVSFIHALFVLIVTPISFILGSSMGGIHYALGLYVALQITSILTIQYIIWRHISSASNCDSDSLLENKLRGSVT